VNHPLSVMILDADNRAALALTRSFGARGVKVFAGGYSRLSQAFFSRYCAAHFLYPVDENGEKMHAAILSAVKRFKPDVLMPLFDRTFSVILKYQDQYREYTRLIPLPSRTAFAELQDKGTLFLRARENKIPVPDTFFPENALEVRSIAGKLKYPVLLKPRLSWGGLGIRCAASPSELCALYGRLSNAEQRISSAPEVFFDTRRPLIQEYIDGEVLNFYGYFDHSALKAFFTTKTIRSYPLPFGHSIAARSIKHGALQDISLSLLRPLGWNGIVDIQYIHDRRDNTLKLIDANPRFWSTIEFAIASGIDFPGMLFQKALDEPVNPGPDFPEGKEFRWILYDELFYLLRAPNKLQAFRGLHKASCEISLDDCLPHCVRFFTIVRSVLNKSISSEAGAE